MAIVFVCMWSLSLRNHGDMEVVFLITCFSPCDTDINKCLSSILPNVLLFIQNYPLNFHYSHDPTERGSKNSPVIARTLRDWVYDSKSKLASLVLYNKYWITVVVQNDFLNIRLLAVNFLAGKISQIIILYKHLATNSIYYTNLWCACEVNFLFST